jgi:Zn finger protein HypA/HybF involved in hydrogenase expression
MTSAPSLIGLWPRHTLYRVACRHCGEPFQQAVANQKYCPRSACQDAKVRRTRERAARTGH